MQFVFPIFSLPFSLSTSFLPLPSIPFPLFPFEVCPYPLWLDGIGERISSPSGSGRSPAAKCIVNTFGGRILGINFYLFDCLMTNNFMSLFSTNRTFP